MNMNTTTFKTVNELAALKMDGFLIELHGDIALIRRRVPVHMYQDKSYVLTHYNAATNEFNWSEYDLTLSDAVNMFYRDINLKDQN